MGTIDMFEKKAADEDQPELSMMGEDPEDVRQEEEDARDEQLAQELEGTMKDYWVLQPVRIRLPAGFETEATYLIKEMMHRAAETEGGPNFFDMLREMVDSFSNGDARKHKIVDLLEYATNLNRQTGYSLQPPRLEE